MNGLRGVSAALGEAKKGADTADLRATFNAFVGQTFYGQMLSAMRETVGESAYFHGGQAERIFQGQLDQVLGEKMAEANASEFANTMFELQFLLPRP